MLNRVFEVRDLGVLLDCKLSFNSHIEHITTKAYRMLGFVFRSGRDFRYRSTLLLLYNSYVRSILEYASTVWNPQYKTSIEALEKIQRKFEKHLNLKVLSRNEVTVALPSLLDRRLERDQVFLYKILKSHIDSTFLLQNINLRCPRTSSRSTRLFSVPVTRTKYAGNIFAFRSCRNYDDLFNSIDIFNCTLSSFKQYVRDVISKK